MIDPISGKPEALCFPSQSLYQEGLAEPSETIV